MGSEPVLDMATWGKNYSKLLVANYTCAFAILLSVCKNPMHRHTGDVHCGGRQRRYSLGTQFGSKDLCIGPYYCAYTEREMHFPTPFTCVYTTVRHSLSPILLPILSISLLHTK